MVEPLRQPSSSSACGFVDGGRTPRRKAFRPPAAHNSTGSTTTTIKLSINEIHPLNFQKRPICFAAGHDPYAGDDRLLVHIKTGDPIMYHIHRFPLSTGAVGVGTSHG
jgi:hypothetical protein